MTPSRKPARKRCAIDDAIEAIVNDVAELPDRTSPDDWPEAMLVTMDELEAILRNRLLGESP